MRRWPISNPFPLGFAVYELSGAARCRLSRPSSPPDGDRRLAAAARPPFPPARSRKRKPVVLSPTENGPLSLLENKRQLHSTAGLFLPDHPVEAKPVSYERQDVLCFGH